MRYLIIYSYIGTRFSGSQIQTKNVAVVNALKLALLKLSPTNAIKIHLTSRTDRGVHALMNTAHVDLIHKYPGMQYDPCRIIKSSNFFFRHNKYDIIMRNAIPVPYNFNAKSSPIHRTYIYRLAVLNDQVDLNMSEERNFEVFVPITEKDFCHVIGPKFDLKKAERICRLLSGKHNFASFQDLTSTDINMVREIFMLKIEASSHISFNYDQMESVKFYDITVQSKSFLYKQVRKIVGAIIGYSDGSVSYDEIVFMLNNPEKKNWNKKLKTAPARGLFLADIKYDLTHNK